MLTSAPVSHVRVDDRGVAWIDGTTMKVIELASAKLAFGWGADELHRQFPHISMAQIHSALAYYYDHQQAIDREIERIGCEADQHRQASLDSPLRQQLRAAGKLP